MSRENETGAEPGSNRAEKELTTTANHTPGNKSNRPRLKLNTVIGTDVLCGWQPVPGITWVQTRSPHFARKLSQRQDSRLVMCGVVGGYLRTFEFRHSLTWAQKLIDRYTRNATPTNAVADARFWSRARFLQTRVST